MILLRWWTRHQTQTTIYVQLSIILLYANISGVNFINVFTCSFYMCRSQKCKKLLDLNVLFVLFGSLHIKAARKILLKLTPGLRLLFLLSQWLLSWKAVSVPIGGAGPSFACPMANLPNVSPPAKTLAAQIGDFAGLVQTIARVRRVRTIDQKNKLVSFSSQSHTYSQDFFSLTKILIWTLAQKQNIFLYLTLLA